MTHGFARTPSLGVVPALIVYLGLELSGVSPMIALGASIAAVVAGLGWLAWRGGLTRMAVSSSVLFIAIAAVVSMTGNLWLFLLKPVATGLVLGVVILANLRRGTRPYSLKLLCRLRPRRREHLLRQYRDSAVIRRRHRTITKVWGIAIIVDGLVRAAALLILPPWLAVISSMPLTFAAVIVGTALSLRYLSGARAAPDDELDQQWNGDRSMDTIEAYRRVSAQAEALVRSIPDDRFACATPCSQWDVRALCNHIYAGDIIVSTRILDLPQPDPKSNEDRLGEDPKAKICAAFDELRGLLAEPGVLDRTVYTHRAGKRYERDLEGLVARRTADLLVHNWDLAKALGRSTDDFDPELVAWTSAHYRNRFDGYERCAPQIIASVAEPKPISEGANDADRLAAFMGRDVLFTPRIFGTDNDRVLAGVDADGLLTSERGDV